MCKPWIVTAISKIDGYAYPSADKLKFGSRAEAEMYTQSLNKLNRGLRWEVRFNEKATLVGVTDW